MERKPLLRSGLVLLAALLVPIVPFAVIGELPGERWMSSVGPDALQFGAAGAGLLASDILIPVPSSIVGALLGARLGFIPGWLWGWGGMVLGNVAGFAMGRLAFRRVPPGFPQAPTLVAVFVSRPVPVLAEALTLVSGANGMGFRAFLAATVAGNGLYAAALAGSGAALVPGALAGPALAVPLLVPAVGWLAWRAQRRRSSPCST